MISSGRLGLEPGATLLALDLREVVFNERARALITLVLRKDVAPHVERLRSIAQDVIQACPMILGVACNLRHASSPRVLGMETIHLAGDRSAPDKTGDTYHYATFGAFVQTNRSQAQKLRDMIITALSSGARPIDSLRALELYGGSGAIGLDLARRGVHVDMIESFAPAVIQAALAASEQGLAERFHAHAGDVLGMGDDLIRSRPPYDVVILNPPRRGVSPATRRMVARARPQAVCYISCDPDTLARDLDHLARLGYSAKRLNPVDMMPLTEEVETFAWLHPAPAPAPTILYEDDEIVAIDNAPHEQIANQPVSGGSMLDRLRLLRPGGDLTPLHVVEAAVSGVCLLAKTQTHASRWLEALHQPCARMIFMVACRGIAPSKGTISRDPRERRPLPVGRVRYRRLAVFGGHSVLRAMPDGYDVASVRRHLASIAHPLLGDEEYGHAPTNRYFEEKHALDRPFCHCVRAEVTHPTTHNRLVIEASLPADLRTVLMRAGGAATVDHLAHKSALGLAAFSSLPPPAIEASRSPVGERSNDDEGAGPGFC
jgi:23S rRNA (uracil1939-C5)-methyltransferase